MALGTQWPETTGESKSMGLGYHLPFLNNGTREHAEGFSRVLIHFISYHKLPELSTQPFSTYEICGSSSDYL